jgi:serine phosphatase RsbU (regulator of sigma subunit)
MSSTKQFQDAFEAGADDFLIKPFNKYELLMRIQFNLKLAKARNENRKQQELLKTQKQEAITQRDIILKQKADLTDDLNYARFVQNAILPTSSHVSTIFGDHFIYHRPKNIVSGDFYWVARKKDLCIVAVGDCTGHGMSGALLTMTGAAFLNEIVGRLHNLTADVILNELRKKVIHFLNQKGEIGEASNGMDISLCIYNPANKIIQFSGANNSLYLVRKGEPLEIFVGDRMPIGYFFDYDQPFTRREYPVLENDMIYLFTDGYPDQFGGPYEKKFRYSQFRELIEKASSLPMEEQKNLVRSTMEDWMEGYEQIDDILVMGIKL